MFSGLTRRGQTNVYKGIVIAAGKGQRLYPLTKDRPKTTLPIFGKPIIEHIFDAFQKNSISETALITGYQPQCLGHLPAEFFHNAEFESNNILHSLMNARSFMQSCMEQDQSLVISYADIYFKASVVSKLLSTHGETVVVLDEQWKNIYTNRDDNPIDQGEMAEHADNNVMAIGKGIKSNSAFQRTEFIGLLKLSPHGIKQWLRVFDDLDMSFDKHTPFHRAAEWQQAYLTDFMSELLHRDETITPCCIVNDWLEFDTLGDYERVQPFSSLDDFQRHYYPASN